MIINGIIWLRAIVDKLAQKHNVETSEVEKTFRNGPRFRRIERGNIAGEDLYAAMGQSDSGRYLVVFFVYKRSHDALIVSARDMTTGERKRYAKA